MYKYGVRGYGLYSYVLECIAFQLNPESPIPQIEEEAQDIAIELKMDTLEVEEIMKFCVNEGLFQYHNNRITCLKMLAHLDNTLSNNPEIRKIMANFKKLEENSSNLKQISLDKPSLDKPKQDKNNKFKKPTIKEIQDYLNEKNINSFIGDDFFYYYESKGWLIGKTPMKSWKAAIQTWSRNSKKFGDTPSQKPDNTGKIEALKGEIEIKRETIEANPGMTEMVNAEIAEIEKQIERLKS
jgi:hypothetical protein